MICQLSVSLAKFLEILLKLLERPYVRKILQHITVYIADDYVDHVQNDGNHQTHEEIDCIVDDCSPDDQNDNSNDEDTCGKDDSGVDLEIELNGVLQLWQVLVYLQIRCWVFVKVLILHFPALLFGQLDSRVIHQTRVILGIIELELWFLDVIIFQKQHYPLIVLKLLNSAPILTLPNKRTMYLSFLFLELLASKITLWYHVVGRKLLCGLRVEIELYVFFGLFGRWNTCGVARVVSSVCRFLERWKSAFLQLRLLLRYGFERVQLLTLLACVFVIVIRVAALMKLWLLQGVFRSTEYRAIVFFEISSASLFKVSVFLIFVTSGIRATELAVKWFSHIHDIRRCLVKRLSLRLITAADDWLLLVATSLWNVRLISHLYL